MSFAEMLGNGTAIAGLQESIPRQRLSSAYLFVGPEGSGKWTLLQAFARTLLCETDGVEACGKCRQCRMFSAGAHPDFHLLEREKQEISVGEMREFCRNVGLRPMATARRVSVVPEADKMTVPAANCFLKTLEEPPGASILLLRSESTDRLLKTVVSRCQIVRLAPLPAELIEQELVRRNACGPEATRILSLICEGCLGKALAFARGESAQTWQWLGRSLARLRPGDALRLADEMIARVSAEDGTAQSARALAQELLDMMALHLRQELRRGEAVRPTLQRLESIWRTAGQLRQNVSPELALRTLALDLAEA